LKMGIRIFRPCIFLCAALIALTGCGEDSVTDTGSGGGGGGGASTNLALRIERTNDFAFKLYQQLKPSGDNLLISPHSIVVAFAMTYAGARGSTEREMADVLCFQYPPVGFHSALRELNELLMSRGGPEPNESFKLSIANGCWGREDLYYVQSYLDTLSEYYGAGLRFLDFVGHPEESRIAINQWVADQTGDRIKDLLPPGSIDYLTYLVLANTIYFRAAWLHRFDSDYTWNHIFTLLDGTEVSVPIMRGELKFPYYEGPGYRAVELPYVGEEVSMILMLPDEGNFEAFESSLDSQKLTAVVDSLQERFSFVSNFDLIPTLRAMGMTEAFNCGANFSGMDGTDDGIPWIDVVVHKTFISVNEDGTEAAAGTGMVMTLGVHDEFFANRPFIFAIWDRETGTILFLGRVLDPRG
jgi:serpin B